jgi:hypothetical protein
MGLDDDRSLRPTVTTLAEQLREAPDRDRIEWTLVGAFSAEFGIELHEGTLGENESAREIELVPSFRVDS